MFFDHPRGGSVGVSCRLSSQSGWRVPSWFASVGVLMLGIAVLGCPVAAVGDTLGFDITVDFGDGLTSSQQAVFTQAATVWESVILGYRPGIVGLSGVEILADGVTMDGSGGQLGYAGPGSTVRRGGFVLAIDGSMSFDRADLADLEANGRLCDVIVHEMGHVLGFGTLWGSNSVSSSGTGEFIGAAALAAYQSEFNQPGASFVPVELGGGGGTAHCHWNEGDGGGLTGITDRQGRDMRDEIMTGWLNLHTFMSQTTIQSFADIGYVVVPEPGVLAMLLGMALVSLAWRAQKWLLRAK